MHNLPGQDISWHWIDLKKFVPEAYEGRNADQIVAELRLIPGEQRDDAYFGVLQGYANWLVKRSASHKTINNHFKIANHCFSFYRIMPYPSDLWRNVNRPKEVKEKLHPLTWEEIYRLFSFSIEKRWTRYLVLIGSAMKIRECIVLRKIGLYNFLTFLILNN